MESIPGPLKSLKIWGSGQWDIGKDTDCSMKKLCLGKVARLLQERLSPRLLVSGYSREMVIIKEWLYGWRKMIPRSGWAIYQGGYG